MNKKISGFVASLEDSYKKYVNLINKNSLISYILVFGFFLVSFLFMYMSIPVLSSGDDHYFHFRFAERLIQDGFWNSFRDFKTLYFTNITNGGHLLYYNFIFYAVLIPFTFITPLYLAIKFYAIVITSTIGLIIFLFIKNIKVKYPFLWTIGFFGVIGLGSFWRLFLSRPFVLSPLIILLLILAIHKKKYFWIFFLSFIPLFWHTSTFFVPILVMIVYFLCYFFYQKKYLWKELLLVLSGTSLSILTAILIDHGFFISIRDNLFSVLSGVLNFSKDKINISEGGEVYPKNFFDLFNQNMFLCTMFISAMGFYVFSFVKDIKEIVNFDNIKKSRKIITMVFFLLSAVFIIAIPNISGRFADFFIFFGWIFVVFIFSEVFSYIEFTNINIKKFAGYAVLISLAYLFFNNVLQLNDYFASSGSRPETFREVGGYFSKNLKKNDVIFNLNWSWFPQLYYYAPEQNYAIGLEPKLTYLYSPRLYWLLVNVGNGYICENEKCLEKNTEKELVFRNKKLLEKWITSEGDKIAEVVINDFKSHYIVSSRDYGYLNTVLNSNKHFKKVVDSNEQYFVYQILSFSDAK